MATAVASDVQSLIQKLSESSAMKDRIDGAEEDVDELKKSLRRIRTFLFDTEQKQGVDITIQHWLFELKQACCAAEDELQLLASSKVCTSSNTSLRHLCQRFEKLALQCDALLVEHTVRLHTIELVVYGRDNDKSKIIESILSNSRVKLNVIPIVGSGGVGKTTLAEIVYNDRVVCAHFDRRLWVYVSEVFDLKRLMKAMVRSLIGMDYVGSVLLDLQSYVRQELAGKRFLLVLDDVWSDDRMLWEMLMVPLMDGLEGSSILVTTRNQTVAKIIQTQPSYCVERLLKEDSNLVFRHYAFSCLISSRHQTLVEIGRQIVEKCKGLPISVKLLASMLRYVTDEDRWKAVLLSEVWNSNDDREDDAVLPAINLAYISLPAPLKQCLVYCSLFPRDFLFIKEHLVRLWIAQGYVEARETECIDDIGCFYFDELLRRSFFQKSQVNDQLFTIHDLVRDCLQSASEKEHCRIESDNLGHPYPESLHLSLISRDSSKKLQLQMIEKPMQMRTLLIINRLLDCWSFHCSWEHDLLHLILPNDMFQNLEFLCALDLSGCNLKTLPDSIGDLKFLRYLGLNRTKLRRLPESICNLCNLQTLELQDSSYLRELPSNIRNLINLQHLVLPKRVHLVPVPPGIGRLTSLRTLSTFFIYNKERHALISELKELVSLRGELCIAGLSNGVTVDDAIEADLKTKKHIDKLSFDWYGGILYYNEEDEDEEEEVEASEEQAMTSLQVAEFMEKNENAEDGEEDKENVDIPSEESHEDDLWIWQFDPRSEENEQEEEFDEEISALIASLNDELQIYLSNSIEDDNDDEEIDADEKNENAEDGEEDKENVDIPSEESQEDDLWISQFDPTSEEDEQEEEFDDEISALIASSNDELQIYLSNSIEDDNDDEEVDADKSQEEDQWIFQIDLISEEPKEEEEEEVGGESTSKAVEELNVQVLASLQPHNDLKVLEISHYPGKKFPDWLADPSFSKLVSVTLMECHHCNTLPPLGLLPSLTYLCLEGFSQLQHIGREFYMHENINLHKAFRSLKKLKLRCLFSLQEWRGIDEGEFPCLHELEIQHCFRLRRMPDRFPALQTLAVSAARELVAIPFLPSVTSLDLDEVSFDEIWSSIPPTMLNKLQCLRMRGIESLEPVPLNQLSALRELEIMGLRDSKMCPLEVERLVFLEQLKLQYCPKIWLSPEQRLPERLKVLNISGCPLLSEWCRDHGSSKLSHVLQVILDREDFHPSIQVCEEET